MCARGPAGAVTSLMELLSGRIHHEQPALYFIFTESSLLCTTLKDMRVWQCLALIYTLVHLQPWLRALFTPRAMVSHDVDGMPAAGIVSLTNSTFYLTNMKLE